FVPFSSSPSIRNLLFFLSLLPPPPRSTLFPYTTLFRSFGFLLVSPVIQLRDFGLHLCQKINCYLFDLLNILFGKIFRKQEIIEGDRKSTRLNSSHVSISYAVFCLKKKKKNKKILARM